METIPNLKAKIAGYLQRAESDYMVNNIDLLLDAINKAHQFALLQHDFVFAECTVDVPVNLTAGARLSPAVLKGTNNYVTVKKVLRAWLGYVPIDFTTQADRAADHGRYWDGVDFSRGRLYNDLPNARPYVSQSGPNIYLFPANTSIVGSSPITLELDVIRYFPDYSDEEGSTDFIMQFGDDFLFWHSVCRLNFFNKEFVQREEGNVGAPKEERKEAWENLLAWDAGMVTTADTTLNLD